MNCPDPKSTGTNELYKASQPAWFLALFCGLLMVAGCRHLPPEIYKAASDRSLLLDATAKLQRRGLQVENVQLGKADKASFVEFLATNATLTIALKDGNTLTSVLPAFQELLRTVDGLGKVGLEVREFLLIPSPNSVVAFCGGRLTIMGPSKLPHSDPSVEPPQVAERTKNPPSKSSIPSGQSEKTETAPNTGPKPIQK